MQKLQQVITFLSNRRIIAALISGTIGITALFGYVFSGDVDTLTTLLTNLFVALGGLLSAVLALLSYFKPKEPKA